MILRHEISIIALRRINHTTMMVKCRKIERKDAKNEDKRNMAEKVGGEREKNKNEKIK